MLREFLAARLDRRSEVGLRLTVNLVIFALAIWAFGGLLDAVLDNAMLVRFDLRVSEWMHANIPPDTYAAMNAFTTVGSPGVWATVILFAAWLWWKHEHFFFWSWLGTNAGGELVQRVLKLTVHRHRPQYAAAFLHGQSYSFPSGHSMGSMICYTMLAFLLARVLGWDRTRKIPMYIGTTLLIVAIGCSRVYLGVHYPSDVLGGFTAGLAWTVACITVINLVHHRTRPATVQDAATLRAAS